jgi:hypothetical protein
MDNNILYFEVEIDGDMLSSEVKPIYDESRSRLLGSFVLKRGNKVACFVAANEPPYSLFFTSNQPFYLTPRESDIDGKIDYAVISEYSISPLSVKVNSYRVSL